MSRSSRITLWCLALLLSVMLYFKGRVPAGKGEGAALLHAGPGTVTVRLAGDFPTPGVFQFADGITAPAAIKMTTPNAAVPTLSAPAKGVRLSSGDILTLKVRDGESPVYTIGRMGTKELILLGIPLDPDLLGADDWACLPGIGPVLSARIVADRQQNGAFGSIERLLRVSGIGPAKVAAIRKYF